MRSLNEVFYESVIKAMRTSMANQAKMEIDPETGEITLQAIKGKGSALHEGFEKIKHSIGATNSVKWSIFEDKVLISKGEF